VSTILLLQTQYDFFTLHIKKYMCWSPNQPLFINEHLQNSQRFLMI